MACVVGVRAGSKDPDPKGTTAPSHPPIPEVTPLMPTSPAPLTFDPWRDAEGTTVPLQSRVEQVAGDTEHGALASRQHQQGQAMSRGTTLVYVLYDHDSQLIPLMSADHVGVAGLSTDPRDEGRLVSSAVPSRPMISAAAAAKALCELFWPTPTVVTTPPTTTSSPRWSAVSPPSMTAGERRPPRHRFQQLRSTRPDQSCKGSPSCRAAVRPRRSTCHAQFGPRSHLPCRCCSGGWSRTTAQCVSKPE